MHKYYPEEQLFHVFTSTENSILLPYQRNVGISYTGVVKSATIEYFQDPGIVKPF